MSATSYRIDSSLHLVRQSITRGAAPAQPAETPTDHILIEDCSGSMAWDLPRIREQLKRKLPRLLKREDTVSIVWFSGRGQCGVLLEAEPVATLTDLKEVERAIDRWLTPQGLTGFKDPLEETAKLIDRLSKRSSGRAVSVYFPSVSAATFVEYGYYADRNLLSAMAEKAGGTLIFAEDFDRYQPVFEAALQKRVKGGKRVELPVTGDIVGGFAFVPADGDILTFAVDNGKVSVPEGLDAVFYLASDPVGHKAGALTEIPSRVASRGMPYVTAGLPEAESILSAAYAALSLYATRMKAEVVFALLRALGDVSYIEGFANCFGKQAYSAFQESARAAAFDPSLRLVKGYDPNKVPRDDAFTVLDVMNLLQQDGGARVRLDDPAFTYSRIGRGRIDATELLTEEERSRVAELSAKMASERDPARIKALVDEVTAITSGKQEGLKFVQDPAPGGYPILSLTFNEERPNVSFLTRRSGKVDLSARLPEHLKGTIPASFETFVYRNYAVVKDGLVNIDVLPVRVSQATYERLKAEIPVDTGFFGVEMNVGGGLYDLNLNLRALPVINRMMVKATSARAFFETQYALAKAQAAQKVYKAYVKDLLPPRKSEGFAAQYGDEAATWLKEQGITDYSGFQPPKTTQAPSTDHYMGKELKVSLKGLSKLPTVKEAKEQIAKGKYNAGGALMAATVKEVEDFLSSDLYKKAAAKEAVLEAWLEGQAKEATSRCRRHIFDIAISTFSIIVGQTWFSEFSSLDENTLTLEVDGQKIEGKAEMREVEIAI